MGEGISAGSLSGVRIERIRIRSPETAEELMHLGSLMDRGIDSDSDFLRVCQLLLDSDEREKAKTLLLANCEEGDPAHRLFDREFPQCEREFAKSVTAYSAQFHCSLRKIRRARHLSWVYSCSMATPLESGPATENGNDRGRSEVQITYESDGGIVADVYPLNDPSKSVPLRFFCGKWHLDETGG